MAFLMDAITSRASRVGNALSRAENYIATDLLRGWTPVDIPDLTGKVAMVTGANSGIGFETARKLAENGAKVYMVSRDAKDGQEAANRIRAEVGKSARLEVLECDMTSLRNVIKLADDFKRDNHTLDMLINVAGVFYPAPLSKTDDGIEHTLGVNYYAPTLLTISLLDILRRTPGARVVFEASAFVVMGRINWNNLTGEKFWDSGVIPYSTSKKMLALWAAELSRRAPDLSVFAVHPGLVKTPLHDKSSFAFPGSVFFKLAAYTLGCSPQYGARSTLYAATEPSVGGKPFQFFGPGVILLNMWPTTERPFYRWFASSQEKAWRLWEQTQGVWERVLGAKAPARVGLLTPGS